MAIVDNNILSSLAKIERLSLLPDLFDEAATVPSVLDELHKDEIAGYGFVDRIDGVKGYRGGWLQISTLTKAEIQLADEIVDATLAFTDAECIAAAENRDARLLTDDRHAGEIASQRGVEVWDLKLLLEAALVKNLIETEGELDSLIEDLHKKDGYRFSKDDRRNLFDRL